MELLVKMLQAEKCQLKEENKVVVDELKGDIQGLEKEREEDSKDKFTSSSNFNTVISTCFI